jgi:hypothetical protein
VNCDCGDIVIEVVNIAESKQMTIAEIKKYGKENLP